MQSMFSERSDPAAAARRDGKERVVARVASGAAGHGIRIMRGGGSVFARHGLISPDVAPFVAFIVDPDELARLVSVLRGDGWKLRPSRSRQLLPPGIVRLRRADFDGTLNLYGVIPGFFADPREAFELLWASRAQMTVGTVDVAVLGRLGTVILAAHDRLEGGRYRRERAGEHSGYFTAQFDALLGPEERLRLRQLIDRLGAEDECRPLLAGLGVAAPDPQPVSTEYVAARLALEVVEPGDAWIVERFERPHGRAARVSFGQAIAGVRRLFGARRRAAERLG